MGRNSTLHPISEFGGGGLNRIVCQLVDCRFYKGLKLTLIYWTDVCICFKIKLILNKKNKNLKVIRFIFIIQMYFLLKDRERVSYEEVSYVLSQKFVDPWKPNGCISSEQEQKEVDGDFVKNKLVPAPSSCL